MTQTATFREKHGAGGALGREVRLVVGDTVGEVCRERVLGPRVVEARVVEGEIVQGETARFVVLRESYSVLRTLEALWSNEEFALATAIAVFSLAVPILKAGLLIRLHMARPGEVGPRLLTFANQLGKWSLTEVFVIAAIIVLWSSNGFASAASLPGLWIFAASTVFLMLAAGRITGALAQGLANRSDRGE